MTTNKTIEEYIRGLNFLFDCFREYDHTEEFREILEEYGNQRYEQGKADQKEIILSSLPEKSSAKLGSENQSEYVAYSNGFNRCLDMVKQNLD